MNTPAPIHTICSRTPDATWRSHSHRTFAYKNTHTHARKHTLSFNITHTHARTHTQHRSSHSGTKLLVCWLVDWQVNYVCIECVASAIPLQMRCRLHSQKYNTHALQTTDSRCDEGFSSRRIPFVWEHTCILAESPAYEHFHFQCQTNVRRDDTHAANMYENTRRANMKTSAHTHGNCAGKSPPTASCSWRAKGVCVLLCVCVCGIYID